MNRVESSTSQGCTVRGCEINRAPLGVFLQALKQVQDSPARLLEAAFPQMDLREILLALKSCDTEMIGQIFTRMMMIVPEQAIKLAAKLTMVPENKLKSDPDIGLDGLAEIMTAWFEVNRIESFLEDARGLYQKLRAQKGHLTNTDANTNT